jgi:hypothetical protein
MLLCLHVFAPHSRLPLLGYNIIVISSGEVDALVNWRIPGLAWRIWVCLHTCMFTAAPLLTGQPFNDANSNIAQGHKTAPALAACSRS